MALLLGMQRVWLLPLRILPLSPALTRLLCRFLIGERLWNRSIMLLFAMKIGRAHV